MVGVAWRHVHGVVCLYPGLSQLSLSLTRSSVCSWDLVSVAYWSVKLVHGRRCLCVLLVSLGPGSLSLCVRVGMRACACMLVVHMLGPGQALLVHAVLRSHALSGECGENGQGMCLLDIWAKWA